MSDKHRDMGQGWGWGEMAHSILVFSCSNSLGQDVYGVLGRNNHQSFLVKWACQKIKLITFFYMAFYSPDFSLNCLINMHVLPRRFSLSLRKWCCIAGIIGLQLFLLSLGALSGGTFLSDIMKRCVSCCSAFRIDQFCQSVFRGLYFMIWLKNGPWLFCG